MHKTLRQQILNKRCQLDNNFITNASSKIACKLIRQTLFQNSRHISLYMPIKGEVDTKPIIEQAWKTNKFCYLPVLNPQKKRHLCFIKYEKNDPLQKNKYGIPEPLYAENELLPPEQLDLVIAPLVGFDQNCNRLGYGGGYYDRTFAFKKLDRYKNKPILIGIAYELQKVPQLSPESWDIPLQMIFTEQNIYKHSLV